MLLGLRGISIPQFFLFTLVYAISYKYKVTLIRTQALDGHIGPAAVACVVIGQIPYKVYINNIKSMTNFICHDFIIYIMYCSVEQLFIFIP